MKQKRPTSGSVSTHRHSTRKSRIMKKVRRLLTEKMRAFDRKFDNLLSEFYRKKMESMRDLTSKIKELRNKVADIRRSEEISKLYRRSYSPEELCALSLMIHAKMDVRRGNFMSDLKQREIGRDTTRGDLLKIFNVYHDFFETLGDNEECRDENGETSGDEKQVFICQEIHKALKRFWKLKDTPYWRDVRFRFRNDLKGYTEDGIKEQARILLDFRRTISQGELCSCLQQLEPLLSMAIEKRIEQVEKGTFRNIEDLAAESKEDL